MSEAHRDKPREGKKIARLISQIEILTKILALNGTRDPPQEKDKKNKTSAWKICKLCSQFHKKPDYC